MLNNLKIKFVNFLTPLYIKELEKRAVKNEQEIEVRINNRVAEILLKMDPFEPLMKKFNGIFSVEYERPEDQLNEQNKIGMYMWAWQQTMDPHFKYMTDWIMNKSGNSLLKAGNPTELQTFYKRAEIANMILYKKEVRRLASNYEEILAKSKGEDFDETLSIEV